MGITGPVLPAGVLISAPALVLRALLECHYMVSMQGAQKDFCIVSVANSEKRGTPGFQTEQGFLNPTQGCQGLILEPSASIPEAIIYQIRQA